MHAEDETTPLHELIRVNLAGCGSQVTPSRFYLHKAFFAGNPVENILTFRYFAIRELLGNLGVHMPRTRRVALLQVWSQGSNPAFLIEDVTLRPAIRYVRETIDPRNDPLIDRNVFWNTQFALAMLSPLNLDYSVSDNVYWQDVAGKLVPVPQIIEMPHPATGRPPTGDPKEADLLSGNLLYEEQARTLFQQAARTFFAERLNRHRIHQPTFTATCDLGGTCDQEILDAAKQFGESFENTVDTFFDVNPKPYEEMASQAFTGTLTVDSGLALFVEQVKLAFAQALADLHTGLLPITLQDVAAFDERGACTVTQGSVLSYENAGYVVSSPISSFGKRSCHGPTRLHGTALKIYGNDPGVN